MIRFARLAAVLTSAALLAGCAVNDLDDTPQPMGRFLYGHNVVVSKDLEIGPMSREVADGDWVPTLRKAMNDRFSRYDGDKYYHTSIVVRGYVLAEAGLPVIAAPKSVLIADAYVYSDEAGPTPLNEEPKSITVFEEGGDVIVGSGLTRTAEEQMESLARNLAKSVHTWMLENKEWFGDASQMDPATTSPGRPVQPLKPQGGA